MIRAALSAALLSAIACSSAEPPVAIEGAGDAPAARGGEGLGDVEVAGIAASTRGVYPAPPYGTSVGATIENLRFLGWEDPRASGYDTQALEPVELASLYDPTGERGISVIVITSTAVWCTVCRAEYEDFQSGKVAAWQDRGVEFVGVLFEDDAYGPAAPQDLATWAELYDVRFRFLLDPSFKLGAFFDRMATPMTMIVDARTMEILWLDVGWAYEGPQSLWGVLEGLLGGG